MSRLDDVIARHAERKKMTSRKATVIVVGIVIVLTILLELFTDLGTPKAPPPGPPPPPVTHVDDVKLMTPPARHVK
ncbi:MAG TPA: hypothetical protein VGG74_10805 [Kofleriaceae bacterium]